MKTLRRVSANHMGGRRKVHINTGRRTRTPSLFARRARRSNRSNR